MATPINNLPLDILYHLFSLLHPADSPHDYQHPFISLSATSKSFHDHVEAYCQHLLTSYISRLRIPDILPPKKMIAENGRNVRGVYLSHVWSRCTYCNRKSVRRAIMVKSLVCCKPCDFKHWNGKITMTDAMKKYHLSKADLFNSKIIHSQYYAINVLTTMFLEADVLALAERIHGDLPAHLQQLATASAARRQKRDASRTLKIAHLRSLLTANGFTGSNASVFPDSLLFSKLFGQCYQGIRIPAMPPLLICRNKILSRRCTRETHFLRHFVQLGADEYFGVQAVGARDVRDWDVRVKRIVRVSTDRESFPGVRLVRYEGHYKDPRDYALWVLFRRDFGLDPIDDANGESSQPREVDNDEEERKIALYEKQAKLWCAVSSGDGLMQYPDYIHPVKLAEYRNSIKCRSPPWAWERFPQPVLETPYPTNTETSDAKEPKIKNVEKSNENSPTDSEEVPANAETSADRELKKLEKRNEKIRADFERVKEWLTAVLKRGGIESPSAWERAVRENAGTEVNDEIVVIDD
ncbi:hypothetical protein RUND412_001152 [Rhizina undulata]